MKRTFALMTSSCLYLAGCVQMPVIKEADHALLQSNYPVISLNNQKVQHLYKLYVPAGNNTLVVIYPTYRFDYRCTFTWTAQAGSAYEITDQYDKYPLTLYRWKRANDLWASRQEPLDPLDCVPETRP